MPFNGSGTFTALVTFVPNTLATAEDQNSQDTDIATGLTNCITRNGQSPATANIPMGGFRITGLGPPVAGTDAVNLNTLNTTGAGVPVATIIMWASGNGSSVPTGYLFCNGQAVSRTTYAALFASIGTGYGSGNGSTTFNVPDYRSRVPLCTGQGSGLTSYNLGVKVGVETQTLTTANLASHTHFDLGHSHGITDPTHAHSGVITSVGTSGTQLASGFGFVPTSGNTAFDATGITINTGFASLTNTGSGTGHNNIQPSVAITFCIKT